MWATIQHLTDSLWPLLPRLTIGLRFCAAVIGVGLAVGEAARRLRRRRRTRKP